jgi:hypothetical protein
MSEEQEPEAGNSIWERDNLAVDKSLLDTNDVFTKIAMSGLLRREKNVNQRAQPVGKNLKRLQRAFTEDQWRAANLSVEVLTGEPLDTWLEQFGRSYRGLPP